MRTTFSPYWLVIGLFVSIGLLGWSGCGVEPSQTQTVRSGLGEPLEGYPSYEERLLLYFTNRLRTDPPSFNPEGSYAPTPPLGFDLALAKAARFHAEHIIEQSCWCEDHSSCCALEGTGDDVSCGGPATGCGAESADSRVGRFSPNYAGENMAMGQTSAAQAIEAWTFSSGHWKNINSPGHSRLGAGNYGSAWVQDFGGGGRVEVIGDGIHWGSGQSTSFGVTYYQPATGGPQTALVIVDGECHDLDVANGVPEHGAFEATVSLGPGCHRYYFHFTDGEGNDWTYPDFGSFAVANNAPDCEFFIDTRPADTCSPSGQTCMTGDTRHCYTGPFGTEAVGICEAGVERCVGGQWDGECRLEVHPDATDTCDDGLDQDCNGVVDDGCGATEDAGGADVGISEPDAGDMSAAPRKSEASDRGGCSAAAGAGPSSVVWPLLFAFVSRRRRKKMEL